MVFLPKNENQYDFCKTIFENEIKGQGLSILGWRTVPVNSSNLGEIALASEPNIEQIFVGRPKKFRKRFLKQNCMLLVK